MKCPKCGAWNAAYLPKCTQCGAPLPNVPEGPAAWEESLHKKKPSLEITTFDEKDEWSEAKPDAPEKEPGFDPEELDRAQLADELEDLKKRREDGKKRIRQMRQQADSIRRSIQEAQIVPFRKRTIFPPDTAGTARPSAVGRSRSRPPIPGRMLRMRRPRMNTVISATPRTSTRWLMTTTTRTRRSITTAIRPIPAIRAR